MGPVAQLVFKTSAVVQPTARSVRLRRRSVKRKAAVLQAKPGSTLPRNDCSCLPLETARHRWVRALTGAQLARAGPVNVTRELDRYVTGGERV